MPKLKMASGITPFIHITPPQRIRKWFLHSNADWAVHKNLHPEVLLPKVRDVPKERSRCKAQGNTEKHQPLGKTSYHNERLLFSEGMKGVECVCEIYNTKFNEYVQLLASGNDHTFHPATGERCRHSRRSSKVSAASNVCWLIVLHARFSFRLRLSSSQLPDKRWLPIYGILCRFGRALACPNRKASATATCGGDHGRSKCRPYPPNYDLPPPSW